MKRFTIPLLCVFFLSCEPHETEFNTYEKSSGVFVINEGNFTYGNASLSFIDFSSNEIENQVFFQANGFPLGDVAYSMTLWDSIGFISINNSGKVSIINTHTFKHLGTIRHLTSPRKILIKDDETAYISDLYSPYITQFNPQTWQKTDSIFVGKSTEDLLLWNNHLLVSCWSFGNQILKIDTETNRVVDSLEVNKQPNSLIMDKNEMAWVLCDGGFEGSAYGVDHPALIQFDPATFEPIKKLTFPSLAGSPNNLTLNNSSDSLFFLYSSWADASGYSPGLYRLSINDTQLPQRAFIPEEGQKFYRMGHDPVSSIFYLSNARDYLQKGSIRRYDSQGHFIDSLQADRIPGNFSFVLE